MKSDARKTAGSASTSDSCTPGRCHDTISLRSPTSAFLISVILLLTAGPGLTQALYKYKGPDGEWVFTDRAPEQDAGLEIRNLPTGDKAPQVSVRHRLVDGQIQFYARNDYHAPVELVVALDVIEDVNLPSPDQPLRWVLPPRSNTELMQLDAHDDAVAPYVSYRFVYLHGDPNARHSTDRPYRAPFALANKFNVSQAFPISLTHSTADSHYAVDIAMPIGTDIHAARGGRVIDVASTNFRAGPNPQETGASANLVRVLHDDGTMAVYAHLNWNTIRVKPGDTIQRGQYIADSGNTGYSTGPHLHFVVVRNSGMRIESLPIAFADANGVGVTPQTGQELTAY